MKLRLLRLLLLADASILFVLGALFIGAPGKVELAFKFHDLPDAVGYLIGLWGCVFATLSIGYAVAALNPLKHRVWVQVGIARGAFGVPTFFVGERMFWGNDRLVLVRHALLSETA